MITPELATLIESGVSIITATRDSGLRPDCVRAMGARVDADRGTVTVFLPVAVAGTSLANLIDNGRFAVAFSRISDHHTVQLKGTVTAIAVADAGERRRVDSYRRALAAELAIAGLPEHIVFRIRQWPSFAVTLRPEFLFDQTPGPKAGALVREADSPTVSIPPGLDAEVEPPSTTPARLEFLDDACFQGLVPSILATCDQRGEPNVTYLSQVYGLDAGHVALSCQFFNKTKRNLLEHPFSSLQIYHPLSFQAWRMNLRFLREEKEGPLFDSMSTRIDVIASHTGMTGVFKLLSADIHEVLSVDRIDDYLLPDSGPGSAIGEPTPQGARLSELRGLQTISARIAGAADLDALLATALSALHELLGLGVTMVLWADHAAQRLEVLGSHGYGDSGSDCVKATVPFGAGSIGTAAESRRTVRMTGVGSGLAYGRAIRGRVEELAPEHPLEPQFALPGLPDAQAQLALPMIVGCSLVGVLVAESRDPLAFDEWDEAFLQIVANQIGARIQALMQAALRYAPKSQAPETAPETTAETPAIQRTRRFVYYRDAETVFLDGEYLVRNIPARILWKILTLDATTGQREFANRELRLDRSLGLPTYRDNLESRLILLRKRLEEHCPDIRLVSVRRGRFALEKDSRIELEERSDPRPA